MIQLTRLNGKSFVLNADLVRSVEAASERDTTITMIDGEHITVRESVDEVVRRAVEYARSVRVFR